MEELEYEGRLSRPLCRAGDPRRDGRERRHPRIEGETGTIAAGSPPKSSSRDENPLENVRNLARIRSVVIRGRVIDRPAVKKMPAIDEALDGLSARGKELGI